MVKVRSSSPWNFTLSPQQVQYMIVVTAHCSVYTLVLMSLDRFLAVVHPITSISIRTQWNALLLVCCSSISQSVKLICAFIFTGQLLSHGLSLQSLPYRSAFHMELSNSTITRTKLIQHVYSWQRKVITTPHFRCVLGQQNEKKKLIIFAFGRHWDKFVALGRSFFFVFQEGLGSGKVPK